MAPWPRRPALLQRAAGPDAGPGAGRRDPPRGGSMNEVAKRYQEYREAGWWRDETFLDDLRRNAAQQPGKTAVIGHSTATGQTERIDYAELSRLTDRMACGLVDLGVRPGEYICVLLPDYWEMFRLAGARFYITAADVFGGRPAEAALALAQDSGLPERVVVFGDDRPAGALSFAEHFLADRDYQEDELAGRCLSPDEPFLLLFTSGTTGTTKAPMHSQNTLYAGIRGYAEALGFDHTLVNTTAHSNMYYAGLVTRLLTSLVLGGTAVCADTWDPAVSLDLIAKHGITTFYGSPPFVRELLAAARSRRVRSSRLSSIVSGSAPVPPQLLDEVRESLGVRMFSLWGMTENGAVSCNHQAAPEDWPAHSDGRPTGGMEIRIDPLADQDDGAGTLWVRG